MLLPTQRNQLELGLMVVEQFWNKGFASEICKHLSEYATQHKTIEKSIAKTIMDNIASMKTLQKFGFQKSRTFLVPNLVSNITVELQSFEPNI